MIDVNWDLAPEGAETLRESMHNGYLRWFNGEGEPWNGREWFETDIDYKIIATRPTQKKTVADAYNELKDMIPDNGKNWTHVRHEPKDDEIFFAYGDNDDFGWEHSYIICTREQFEAYVKEQESEKWTHRLDDGDMCKVIYKGKKKTWVLTEYTQDRLVKNDNLKPINPTISESEAIDILMVNKRLSFAALLEDYDVVKD